MIFVTETKNHSEALSSPYSIYYLDPIIEYVNDTLANFSDSILMELNTTCSDSGGGGRMLQDVDATNSSLASKIEDAIAQVNSALKEVGIVISPSVEPYFDGSTFSAGVNTTLEVTFSQSAANLVGLIQDVLDGVTNSSADVST